MFAKSPLFAAAALFALEASAFFRLPCPQRLSLERLDPIVTPGEPAVHVHTIHGGSGFGMNSTNDDLRKSDCTSCWAEEDKSAYWTPNLYWQDDETKELTALNQTGGMLVYYLQRTGNKKGQLEIFPPDFRMIAGDARQRNFTWDKPGAMDGIFNETSTWSAKDKDNEDMKRQLAVGFNCLDYSKPAEGALYRNHLPQKKVCKSGLRAEIMFPSCWNGKDSDSPDHRSHVRYPSEVHNGDCPKGFEKRLPTLFFETIWDISIVEKRNMKGRLILSDGDPTGYAYHGDFMNGWDQGILRRAMDECTDESGLVERCKFLTPVKTPEKCQHKTSVIKEEVFGPLKALPGCNPITEGPEYAPEGHCDKDGKPPASLTSSLAAPSTTKAPSPSSSSSKAPAVSVSSKKSDNESGQKDEDVVDAPPSPPPPPPPSTSLTSTSASVPPAGAPPAGAPVDGKPADVIVTATVYHTDYATVQADPVVETVYAPAVTLTKRGAAAEATPKPEAHLGKRHAHHHMRRHQHGHHRR